MNNTLLYKTGGIIALKSKRVARKTVMANFLCIVCCSLVCKNRYWETHTKTLMR